MTHCIRSPIMAEKNMRERERERERERHRYISKQIDTT
jgi:hypothetical protein